MFFRLGMNFLSAFDKRKKYLVVWFHVIHNLNVNSLRLFCVNKFCNFVDLKNLIFGTHRWVLCFGGLRLFSYFRKTNRLAFL